MTLVFSTIPNYSSVKRPNMTMSLNSYGTFSKMSMNLGNTEKKGCRACGN
jgi:hypothetical protein